jgi:hypothetical protein
VVSAAIPTHLNIGQDATDETKLRTYLKTQSNTIPQLIANIGKMVSAAAHPLAAEYGQATFQLESNAIVLVSMVLLDISVADMQGSFDSHDLNRHTL